MPSSRDAVPSRKYPTPLLCSLPLRQLKDILGHVVPEVTVNSAQEFTSLQLPQLYTLNMSDNRKLLLSYSPNLAVRLLRHESTLLPSEAKLVSFVIKSDLVLKASHAKKDSGIALKSLVPKLLKHSSDGGEIASPYSVFESTPGTPLYTVASSLSSLERRYIDKQIGSLAQGLASLTSPSGKFGAVAQVLPDPWMTTTRISGQEGSGSKTWSEAFHYLLEGVLRDGEDMAVLLPYEAIRSHYQRSSWRLDAVLSPRLVILNIESDDNVMIEINSDEGAPEDLPNIRVVGLRNWGLGIFGDPLIADCFADPSEDFLEGWRGGANGNIEDRDGAEIRLMIYQCFRAVVDIVRGHYRPKRDSSMKELDARRRLTGALAQLEKVYLPEEMTIKRKHTQSSQEAASSKRQKSKNKEFGIPHSTARDTPTL